MANHQASAGGLLAFFWDHFDAKGASIEDLEFLATASDEASGMALSLSAHVSNIGSMINFDQSSELKSGCMQDDEQSSLLFRIAEEIDTIGRMAYIGSEADYELRKRLSSQLESGVSRRIQSHEQSSILKEGA